MTITAALAQNPIYGSPASVAMITKGGLNAITLSLASEYAKEHIRFNAVAPGVVDSPLHKDSPPELLKTLSPMGNNLHTGRDRKRRLFVLSHRIAPDHRGGGAKMDGGAHNGKMVAPQAVRSPAQRGATAAGPRNHAPQSSPPARCIRRGGPDRQPAIPQRKPADQGWQASIHRPPRQGTRCRCWP